MEIAVLKGGPLKTPMTTKKKKTAWQKLPLITCTKCEKKIPKGDTVVQIGLLYGLLSAVACVPCARKLLEAHK